MPSTVIAHMEYDPETQRLTITFRSGFIYVYYKVPNEVYDLFKKYQSKGQVFNRYIKDRYDYDKLN